MNPATQTLGSVADGATPHHRRSREEVEALAKNFVAAPTETPRAPAKPRTRVALAGAGVTVLALLVFMVWPQREEIAHQAQPDSSRAAMEAEQWRQRYEAERERKRRELAAGNEYLERMAAADSALMKDMTSRADKLAARAAVAPSAAAAAGVPTPREEPARARVAAAPVKPAPTQSRAAPTSQPEAAKVAPTTAAAPSQVAQAPAASCSIHVSELSSSGKLTYQDVTRMKGARLDPETGYVLTPPVKAAGGRSVVFEVGPDGCVRVRR